MTEAKKPAVAKMDTSADEEDPSVLDEKQDQYEEEQQQQDKLLAATELKFLCGLQNSETRQQELKSKLLASIKEHKMGPFYSLACKELKWTEDAKFAAELKAANEAELKELDAKITEATDTAGDTEVRDAMWNRAEFFARIGDKEQALKAYDETLDKTVGSGGRIDVQFAIIRLGLAFNDSNLVRTHVGRAKNFVEKGGDWERRNLLSVYEATYLMSVREFKDAAKLLLDSVATFTAHKLYSYNQFIFYTVLCSIVSLDRVTLRDKVVRAPDILTVIRDVPHLHPFLFSLYQCHYGVFFKTLADIAEAIKVDRYLAPHSGYLLRETRIVAYTQYLESYRSVTLASMASTFGVSNTFIDRELARFIAAGRLNCKIDKVGGIVETNRPDAKNTQYAAVLKQGDLLLNRIQKLSKVVSF